MSVESQEGTQLPVGNREDPKPPTPSERHNEVRRASRPPRRMKGKCGWSEGVWGLGSKEKRFPPEPPVDLSPQPDKLRPQHANVMWRSQARIQQIPARARIVGRWASGLGSCCIPVISRDRNAARGQTKANSSMIRPTTLDSSVKDFTKPSTYGGPMTITERAIQTLQRMPPAEAQELALRMLFDRMCRTCERERGAHKRAAFRAARDAR